MVSVPLTESIPLFFAQQHPRAHQHHWPRRANWANQGTKEIHLLFASTGGNVDAGISAYNVLRSLPIKLVTYNGNVDSIATIIFLAGDERIAVPHATFMFHGVAFDWSGNIHADQPFSDSNQKRSGCRDIAASAMSERKFDSISDILTLFPPFRPLPVLGRILLYVHDRSARSNPSSDTPTAAGLRRTNTQMLPDVLHSGKHILAAYHHWCFLTDLNLTTLKRHRHQTFISLRRYGSGIGYARLGMSIWGNRCSRDVEVECGAMVTSRGLVFVPLTMR